MVQMAKKNQKGSIPKWSKVGNGNGMERGMFKANANYLKLPGSYLFSTVASKILQYCEENPEKAARIVRLGIGDVTQPLAPSIVAALHGAVDEMASAETFRGYAPDLGYDFLRETIASATSPHGALPSRLTRCS